MSETFTSRIEDWREDIKRRLRQKWWYMFIIAPIGYVLWAVFIDGVVTTIKEYAKGYANDHVAAISQLSAIHLTAILRPLIGTFILCVLFLMILVAHAYWETRPAKISGRIATIDFTGYELHRTPEPRQINSIFLRAKIELSGIMRTTVTRYRMELSCLGVLTTPELRDDVDRFEITDWSRDPIPHEDMRPLPKELTSGSPVEGWVHFITDWNEGQLYGSYVRLFADTPNGSGSLEIRPGRNYWNVVQNRMIVEKHFGSISLDQLS